jgi:energy-coupling factor transporter transmembrane protein EcfT
MELIERIPLKRIFVVTTIFCIGSFFALLFFANSVNRKGITELNDLNKESIETEAKLRDVEQAIATYSSLSRVEERSKALGFEQTKNIEYIK